MSGLPPGGSGRPLRGFRRQEKEGTRREVGSSERRGLPGPEDVALFFELPKALLGGSEAVSEETDSPSSYPACWVGAATSGRTRRFRGGEKGTRRGISTIQRQRHTYVRTQERSGKHQQIEG